MTKVSLEYQPQIDGLRAIAVIGVILFHMKYQWISGGFVGVDIFFVISGYLITSIILKEHENRQFKISKFMVRRIKRILPALLTMLFVISIVIYFLLFIDDINSFGEQSLSAIFSCSNIFFWKTIGSYWGPSANNLPLLHMWSLSLEEQFYLVYPLILMFFLSFRRKYAFFSILVIALCSFFLYLYDSSLSTFYLLPMRAWEIAAVLQQ
ncbi:MAG: acyltransferase [Parachlamydiales bacterium]|jgi:peptidoglycan/LPS O-acetylase OafA/YrhL